MGKKKSYHMEGAVGKNKSYHIGEQWERIRVFIWGSSGKE